MPELKENLIFLNLRPQTPYKDFNKRNPSRGILHQGTIAIIPAGYRRRWSWLSQLAAANLFISPRLLTQASRDLVKGEPESIALDERSPFKDAFIANLIMELLSELESKSPNGRLYIDTLSYSLSMYLILRHSSARLEKKVVPSQGVKPSVYRAIDFIRSNLGEELSLNSIAAACDLSVSYLCSVFRSATGVSVHQFVIQERISRSKSLLRFTDMEIVEIAQAVGFSSQSHLTTTFHKICGTTPGQYRKETR